LEAKASKEAKEVWEGVMHPPFKNVSVFTVLTPPPSNALTPRLQICGAALAWSPRKVSVSLTRVLIGITKQKQMKNSFEKNLFFTFSPSVM